MFRQGVEAMLEDYDGVSLAWGAADSAQANAMLETMIPDVILMDISLGVESGIELTRNILARIPTLKIIGLSMHKEDNYIVQILEAGAKGYLLKDAGADEMVKAITQVCQGGTYYSDHVTKALVHHVTRGAMATNQEIDVVLTKREVEILKLIAEEHSNPEIAEMLYISIRTVDTHRRNLLDKLEVKNTVGLVKYAIKQGLVS